MALQAHTQTHTSYECCGINSVLKKKKHILLKSNHGGKDMEEIVGKRQGSGFD